VATAACTIKASARASRQSSITPTAPSSASNITIPKPAKQSSPRTPGPRPQTPPQSCDQQRTYARTPSDDDLHCCNPARSPGGEGNLRMQHVPVAAMVGATAALVTQITAPHCWQRKHQISPAGGQAVSRCPQQPHCMQTRRGLGSSCERAMRSMASRSEAPKFCTLRSCAAARTLSGSTRLKCLATILTRVSNVVHQFCQHKTSRCLLTSHRNYAQNNPACISRGALQTPPQSPKRCPSAPPMRRRTQRRYRSYNVRNRLAGTHRWWPFHFTCTYAMP
jgi:hypothetical protein